MRSDEIVNIEFVELVKKYPIIYTVEGHTNQAEIRQAWSEIASILGKSSHSCKYKWRILRGGFTRYLKSKRIGQQTKDYYLARHMQFLIPYLKYWCQTEVKNENYDDVYEEDNPIEIQDDDDDDEEEYNIELKPSYLEEINNANQQESQESDELTYQQQQTRKRRSSRCQSPEFVKIDKSRKTEYNPEEEDTDMDFFKSILPDVRSLSSLKKYSFKISVMKTLSELLHKN